MNTIQALIGMLFLLGTAYALSTNRKAINWRIVLIGLIMQSTLFLVINYVPAALWCSKPSAPASPKC